LSSDNPVLPPLLEPPAEARRVLVPCALFAALLLTVWGGVFVTLRALQDKDAGDWRLGLVLELLSFALLSALLLWALLRRLLHHQRAAFASKHAQLAARMVGARAQASQHLQEVLARVGDGFLTLDDDRRFSYINPHALKLLARSNEGELLGRHFWTELPGLIGTTFYQALEHALNTRQPVLDATYTTPLGRVFEGRIYPSVDNGISVYFTDVTERRRTDESLRLSELRYRLASAPGHVWDWDVHGGGVTFADAFWLLFGLTPPPSGEVTRCFQALLHPDDVRPWRHALRDHLSRGVPYDLVYRARAGEGSWRWFHTQGQAVWDEQGRATYMAGTTFEITQRKQAEIALQQSEAYRRVAFEELADGVVLTDLQRNIIDANPQMLRMLGYSRRELLQFKADVMVHESHYERLQEVLRRRNMNAVDSPWAMVRKDGSRFAAEVYSRAIDGQRLLAVVRDVTAKQAAEKALQDMQLELSELARRLLGQEKATTQRLAQTLHDNLGQTLAVARLNLDACIGTHGSTMPASLKGQTKTISNLLDRAVREVRQVLADLRPPLLQEQGLVDAFENEIRFGTAAASGIDVLLELGDNAAGQRWPDDVEYAAFMVAREAVANAVQHAQASLVRILLEGDETHLRVDVIDDGVGIALPMAAGRAGHLGMVGMRERSLAIAARFEVAREDSGGTRISLIWQAGSA
jgi:PAS domain S-box-containing protein